MHDVLRVVRGFGGVLPTFVRLWRTFMREGFAGIALRFRRMLAPPVSYAAWRTAFEPPVSRADRAARLSRIGKPAAIDVLMAAYRSDLAALDAAIASLVQQSYPHWRLIIWDDGSQDALLSARLADWAAKDNRIAHHASAENRGIAAAANAALAQATGEWVTVLDHDDLLAEDALLCVAEAIAEDPRLELIYSDEDKIDAQGVRFDPHFKPGWSPEYLRGCNYLNHLTVARRSAIEALGGWRSRFDGAQDHDLWLRLSETIAAPSVRHIPKVLYHWRAAGSSAAASLTAKPEARAAAIAAVAEHLARAGLGGQARACAQTPFIQVTYPRPDPVPMVSVIIPNRDQPDMLGACLASLRGCTDYPNLDILVVDNQSRDARTAAIYQDEMARGGVRVISYDAPFNYARMNNLAAAEARGDLLLLLNNDVEAIAPGWLDAMVALAMQKDAGCVGAKLLYPNRTIQHAGVAVGVCGVGAHIYRGAPQANAGDFGRLALAREVSAVTAACLLVRASIYREVAGLDEVDLKIAFNDVDFCLKVRETGRRNLWTPHATLIHHESVSRGYEITKEKYERFQAEACVMARRWGDKLLADPYYSPNLTVSREDGSLRDATAPSAALALLQSVTSAAEAG